jgi:hypothetical protein
MEDIHMATPSPSSANINTEARAEHGSKVDDIRSSLGTFIVNDFGVYRYPVTPPPLITLAIATFANTHSIPATLFITNNIDSDAMLRVRKVEYAP